ncbi:MAG TPA: Bax inhibitor-1/YccA family protein [Candidatus Limnocylindrales bacterium]
MNDYRFGFDSPDRLGVRPSARLSAGFLSQTFGWMFAGLLLTAGVAFLVQSSSTLLQLAAGLAMPVVVVELVVVFGLSFAISRIPATVALGAFFLYAAVNGVLFGLITAFYPTANVAAAFLSASAMFGVAAVYGATTGRSLLSMGGLLTMGLVGLFVAMLVNVFLASSGLSFLISIVGVVLFTALTAYSTQRIARGDFAAAFGSMEKASVYGALTLYLDFVNLFLMFLRLFGGGGRRG